MTMLPARDQTSPSGYVARREHAVMLAAALNTLPEDQRTAVELRYIGDCSFEEIAAFMNRTMPSVAGLLRRGLAGSSRETGAGRRDAWLTSRTRRRFVDDPLSQLLVRYLVTPMPFTATATG